METKWDEIKAVIEKDCEIRFFYKDSTGSTCFIGGLIEEAGGSISELLPVNNVTIAQSDNHRGAAFIEEHYGLTLAQQEILQAINDHFKSRENRQEYLLAQLDVFMNLGDSTIELPPDW